MGETENCKGPVAVSTNGGVVAVSGGNGTVRIVSPRNRVEMGMLTDVDAKVMAFSPDGTLLAVSAEDGLRLFDLRTLKQVGHAMPTEFPQTFAFSHDGKLVAAVGPFHVRVFAVATGEQVAWLHPTPGPGYPGSVAFSADDTLAVGSSDGDIGLWNIT